MMSVRGSHHSLHLLMCSPVEAQLSMNSALCSDWIEALGGLKEGFHLVHISPISRPDEMPANLSEAKQLLNMTWTVSNTASQSFIHFFFWSYLSKLLLSCLHASVSMLVMYVMFCGPQIASGTNNVFLTRNKVPIWVQTRGLGFLTECFSYHIIPFQWWRPTINQYEIISCILFFSANVTPGERH